MPSFDIESKIDNHELSNAIDQTNRVITNRYDLKDCLLYTSPSPRDRTRSRMPSSA